MTLKKLIALTACIGAIGALCGRLLVAQDIVLVPGTISGTVSLGTLPVTQVQVNASPQGGGSTSFFSTPFNSAGALTVPYAMTVSVPEAGSATYIVDLTVRSDSNRDVIRPARIPVNVSSATPGQADVSTTEPGFVAPNFSVTGGATVASASLSTFVSFSPSLFEQASTSAPASQNWVFAVLARQNIQLNGSVVLSNGLQVPLPQRIINVEAGVTTTVDYTIDGTAAGSIGGTVAFAGPLTPQRMDISASGSTFKSIVQQPVPADGVYSVGPLLPGNNYSLSATARFNNFDDAFSFPVAAYVPQRFSLTVGSGETSVNVTADQSFINGTLQLTGASSYLPFINGGSVNVTGLTGTPTSGGSSSDQLTSASRAFDLVVSEGTWRFGSAFVSFFRPAPALNGSFSYSENRIVPFPAVGAGETIDADLSLDLGEISLSISVAGGATFSNPSVFGSCVQRDASNNILWSTSFNFSTFNQVNVSQGTVTFVTPGGQCTFTPRVVINNQTVPLPGVAIAIVPGTSQVVDLGGPTLTLTSPAPEVIVSGSSLVVSGKASDDVAVAGVTVNGGAASISSSGNPAIPSEVNFSRFISLVRGPNVITTVASDVSTPAKTTTDTRTVYFDTALPTLTVTAPPDGLTTFASTVAVTGTANDDAGVKKITVNGTETPFTATGPGNLVSFSGDVPLNLGANTITVIVTDISNRTTTVTRTVTRQQQVPTSLAVAPATAVYGGTVTLSATLTSDGAGIGGKTITFSLNGTERTAVTNAAGVATAAGVSINGMNAMLHTGAISASFEEDDDYLASSGTANLTIARGTATLTLGGLLHTFDGTAKAATVATSPAGLGVVTIAYDGGGTVPVNAGSYAVTATLANDNYHPASTSGTSVIEKASQTIAFAPLPNKVFGDPSFDVSAVASSGLPVVFQAAGRCSLTGNSVTIASGGACTITAAQPGNHNFKAAEPVSQSLNVRWTWSNVLPPINVDGSSIFKLNRTVPVKFALTGAGTDVSTLTARLFLAKISGGVIGTELEPDSTSAADVGHTFRYDAAGGQYIFNLGTKGLSQGTWQIRIDLGDGSTNIVMLSLRK